ncbi:MAG: SdrD B-like domain-containing protein [Campylobacterota bacterium]|nr:SdrD B-like domain-containing protein [Campylobacterota bacterium]
MKKVIVNYIRISILTTIILNAQSYDINKGWQLLGTSYDIELNDFNKSCINTMWSYDMNEKSWEAFSPNLNTQNSIENSMFISKLDNITKKDGFWINANQDCEVVLSEKTDTQNVSIFTGAIKTKTSEDNITSIEDLNVTITNSTYSFSTITDIYGNYYFYNIPYGIYSLIINSTNYNEVHSTINLNSTNVISYEQIILIEADDESLGYTYTFKGNILDAISGYSINGVTVDIYEGLDNTNGEILDTIITDYSGSFNFTNLVTGYYTILFKKDGYIKNISNLFLNSNKNGDIITQDFTMAPFSDNIRIVLSWGETPYDLDSHFAKMVNNLRQWHIYYGKKNQLGAESNLDVDDTYSYGPETTTLTSLDNNSIYKYYVHDFSNSSSSDSSSLSNSGAKVKIYIEENEYTFNVPNYKGTIWKVFEIVNGDIIPCIGSECMKYESSSNSENYGLMKKMNIDNNYDIDFINLPKK